MLVLKTTTNLKENIWNEDHPIIDLPKRYEWLKSNCPKFSDIDLWEQVYKEPGNFGVYVAWSPYVEFYIIVHYLFEDNLIEQYTNLDEVLSRVQTLGINLPVNRVWIAN